MKNLKLAFSGIILASALMSVAACSSSDEANRVLGGAGYTEIHTTGHSFFGCSQDDTFATGFTAVDARGQKVKGAVCSGLLKGATIRIF